MSTGLSVAPELNMTVAEVIQRSTEFTALSDSTGHTFFFLLFAYIAACYIAAKSLTRNQLILVNVIYFFIQLKLILLQWSRAESSYSWANLIQGTRWSLGEAQQYLNDVTAIFSLVFLLLSMAFAQTCRKKTQ